MVVLHNFIRCYKNASNTGCWQLEGTFEVVSPVAVLGYSRLTDTGTTPGSKSATHLTLYMTLEPTLPQPPQMIKVRNNVSNVLCLLQILIYCLS